MFWDAVVGGLRMFTHWQTYVAIVEFLLISWIPMVIIGFAMESGGRAGGLIGCLSMLVLPLLQTFAIAVFVLTLGPIILGLSKEAAWSFPWVLAMDDWWVTVKFIASLFFAALVLAFIPFIGKMHSFTMLIIGAVALMIVLGLVNRAQNGIVDQKVHFWPGFWFALGLFVVGALLGWLGMLVAAMVGTIPESIWPGTGTLLAVPIGAIFGFLPLFIYGAWLAAQLHAPG